MTDTLLEAWRALTRHRMRGLLAVCGVAIGITAITGIISAEASWSKALDETFARLGVTKVAVDPPAADAEAMRRQLTLDDAAAVREECSLVKSLVPVSWANLAVKVGSQVQTVTVKAGGVGVEEAHAIQMVNGRRLSEDDLAYRAPVCLVVEYVADKLFGSRDATGRMLRIAGRGFTVVGTFGDQSGDHGYRQAMVGRRAEVYIPITTAQRIPQLNGVHKMIVEADDQVGAAAQINALMRDRLRARPEAEFAVSAATMKEAAVRARRRLSVFVGLAGFLALLIAGIGVANLLFVSVAERAREIGVRRACGASAWSIAWQVLMESVVLCVGGAAVGVGLAVAVTRGFFAVAFPDRIGAANPITSSAPVDLASVQLPLAEPTITWTAVLIGGVVALLVGLVAGSEPALAAAQVPPAEAIRTSPVPRHRLRNALTILQVALGVVAVMLLVSLYEGRARTELSSLREGEAADVVSLQFADAVPGMELNNSMPAIYAGLSQIVRVLKEPARFRGLLDDLTLFAYFDPRMTTRVSVRSGARALRLEGELPVVCGTVPNGVETDIGALREADMLPEGAGASMAAGEFFSDRDLDEAQRVCVLPHSVAVALFGSGSAIGGTVVIGGRPFRVVGVLSPWVEEIREMLFPTTPEQLPVLVPATTFAREIYDYPEMMDCFRDGWYHVLLRVKDLMQGPAALSQLEPALLSRIRLPKHVVPYPRGSLVSAADIANRQRWAELRAGAGGAAALLIALVGLVNMLLVSVHESVREVGLRRALGALRSQVGWQFLREGVTLAALGAAIGILLALPGVRWLGGIVDVPVHLPAKWAVLVVVGAIVAGGVASVGPALKGAYVQPAEALHYE